MSIDRDEVEHIAKLARIELEDGEVEQFAGELGEILGYVEKLEELDTEDVEPMTHAVDVEIAMREDEVEEPLEREEALKNAPESEEGHFRVPKVVE